MPFCTRGRICFVTRFRQLVDLNFIAAMTPSAGRPQITGRYQRRNVWNFASRRPIATKPGVFACLCCSICKACLPFRWQALQLLLLAGISGWKPSTYFPNHHVKSLGRELKPTEKRLEVGLQNWWWIQYEQNQWFQKLSFHVHFVRQLPSSRQWFLGKFPGQACTSWQSSLQIQLCCQHPA